jgi:uncharacterized membrane protein
MDLTAIAVPWPWVAASWLAAAAALAWAIRAAPWRRLADGATLHVWCGGIVAAAVLWTLRATVGDGFTFHLLGAAALALVVGAPLALIGAAAIVAVSIATDGGLWQNAAIAFVTLGVVPVAVATAVLRVSQRRLPPNFFVYVFVAGYFGAGLSLAAGGFAGALALWLAAGRPAERVFGEYAPWLGYLGFGEAMLTGMIVTLAVVYRPQWVATFDDARYIAGR